MCTLHVCKWKNTYIKDLNALCIYLGEKGGGALMHVYVWEHSQPLLQNRLMDNWTKLGRDEMIMAQHMHKDVLVISAQGWIQGEAK